MTHEVVDYGLLGIAIVLAMVCQLVGYVLVKMWRERKRK